MATAWINTLGLSLDIVGVFFLALEPFLKRFFPKTWENLHKEAEHEKRSIERAKRNGIIGLLLVVGGFSVQILANWV